MNNVVSIFKNQPTPKAKETFERRERKPLYSRETTEDFGERVVRIRASLDRINVLMGELKKMSAKAQKDQGK